MIDSFDKTGTTVFTNGIVGAGEWVIERVNLHGFGGMVANALTHWINVVRRTNGRRSNMLATADRRL